MLQRVRLLLIVSLAIALLGLGLLALLSQSAPQAAGLRLSNAPCQTDVQGQCLRLAQVTATNLAGQDAEFPAVFSTPLNLVVMPFDREQQIAAALWLPVFESLAVEGQVDYFSLAALDATRIAPLFRAIIRETMNATVQDGGLRQRTYLVFLDDQSTFIQALGIEDIAQMRVLILNQQGERLHLQSGPHSPETESTLVQALAALQSP
ncbi:MAG: hypothetical protein NZ750_05695 [Anaerolineae bacterium]|nr:hypothetical protein [Anaerolineae bacterium]MDW8172939.1 hypothetical protein [Anaerolineae bacterium]